MVMEQDGIQRYWLCLEQSKDQHSSGIGTMTVKVATDSKQQTSYLGREVEKIGVDSCNDLSGGEGSCCVRAEVLVGLQTSSLNSGI